MSTEMRNYDDIKIDLKQTHVIFNNDHSNLNNLDFEHSGHTGFASRANSAYYIEVEQSEDSGIPYTILKLKNIDDVELSNATIPASKGIQDVQLDAENRKLVITFYDTDTLECDFDELFFKSQVKNEFDNSEDTVYSTEYVNSRFAQINYLSNFWCEKINDEQVNLVKEKPTSANTNFIERTNDNSEYEWTNPEFIAIKELNSEITLTKESSFVFTIQFSLNANANLSFGAIIYHSEDGNDWTPISSQQVFTSKDYSGSGTQVIGYTENLTIYTDSLDEPTAFNKNTYLGICIFKKILNATDPTIRYYFGVNINNNDINSYVKFNFQSIRLDGSELEDNSVTLNKLADDVKNKFVEKKTTISGTKLYAANGQNQVMMGVSMNAEGGSIAQYDLNGRLKTETPTEDKHAVQYKQIKTTFDGNTPKNELISTLFAQQPKGFRRLLGINQQNEISIVNIASDEASVLPNRIPYYRSAGNPDNIPSATATIPVCTPLHNDDAANKKYVDDTVAEAGGDDAGYTDIIKTSAELDTFLKRSTLSSPFRRVLIKSGLYSLESSDGYVIPRDVLSITGEENTVIAITNDSTHMSMPVQYGAIRPPYSSFNGKFKNLKIIIEGFVIGFENFQGINSDFDNVEVTDSSFDTGVTITTIFSGCRNIHNINMSISSKFGSVNTISGCANIYDCVFSSSQYGTDNIFINSSNINNVVVQYDCYERSQSAFVNCRGVKNCLVIYNEYSLTTDSGYTTSYSVQSGLSMDYLCNDTPNGGFNATIHTAQN